MSTQDRTVNEFVNKSFNPLEISKKALKENFVIRQDEYQEILDNISDVRLDRAQQNYLIVGQRGMGKTTLMLRLRYEIEEDSKLKKKLFPIQFPEEQYFVQDLASLWQYTIEFLSADYKKELGHLQGLANEIAPLDSEFEEKLAELLFSELKDRQRVNIIY
ncbi:MAG: ATP-binding protein [Chitinophagales bacterium]